MTLLNEVTGYDKDSLTPKQAWCLYLTHFLYSWTSRTYGYATILFIQNTFPGDLLPSSINGIVETVSVVMLSATLGRLVDQSPTRLKPMLLSIWINRVALVICCTLWLLIFLSASDTVHRVLFAILLIGGTVEKVSKISNSLSTDRDWIPTVADYSASSESSSRSSYTLTHLNTISQRIEIICKFLAPLAITASMTVFDAWLTAAFICIVGAVSCVVETWSILFVWKSNTRLRRPKPYSTSTKAGNTSQVSMNKQLLRLLDTTKTFLRTQIDGLQFYFSSGVWIPSLAIGILHSSVLAWSGTLITWLLNCGFSYNQITIGKTAGGAFEIGSTFVFPWAVALFSMRGLPSAFGGAYHMVSANEDANLTERDDDQLDIDDASDSGAGVRQLSPIILTAQWSVLGHLICMVPTLAALFGLDAAVGRVTHPQSSVRLPSLAATSKGPLESSDPFSISPGSALVFIIFLSLSILGLYTYDLSVVQLTQITIPASRRSEFGGTEMALLSLVTLSHWIGASVWHQQSDFKWLAVASVCGVTIATGGYTFWATRWWRKVTPIATLSR